MRYYSEDTVRDIIKGVAHTALEQSENFADAILQNKPNIEISEPHGDLIDRQKLLEHRFEVYDSNEEVCEDYIETYHVIEAPIIIEASTSPAGFCNTEGCSNSKPDMTKAQNHICPYYKGVCSLDGRIICYCQHHYEMCDKFIEASKERE